jgi:hypothetical protein
MNESDYIDCLVRFAESEGIVIELYAFDLPCLGRYDFDAKTIRMNDPDARSALMTLAHELGHHIGYELNGERNKLYSQLHLERQAYVYGWRVLCDIGADVIVSRSDWIANCKESHVAFLRSEQSEPTS